MNLSSDLVSQFAKITNDNAPRSTEETILYGEIVQFGDELCVKFDGSDQMTPAVTTSTIKVGDRVSAVIKNHTAIITGNLSDPAVGEGKVSIDIDQKVGVIFTGLEEGTTIINGACIKTGTIDAQYLNLTGAITFVDLSQEVVDELNDAELIAEEAIVAAEEAYDIAVEARTTASSISIPNYIKNTYIASTEIRSPEITGNNISVYGTFQTIGHDGVSMITTGYMGAVKGMDAEGNTTLGVALSNEWNSSDYTVGDKYIIVTNGGARMQAGTNSITVTSSSAQMSYSSGKYVVRVDKNGCRYYDGTSWKDIGSGAGGTITPVWG